MFRKYWVLKFVFSTVHSSMTWYGFCTHLLNDKIILPPPPKSFQFSRKKFTEPIYCQLIHSTQSKRNRHVLCRFWEIQKMLYRYIYALCIFLLKLIFFKATNTKTYVALSVCQRAQWNRNTSMLNSLRECLFFRNNIFLKSDHLNILIDLLRGKDNHKNWYR